MAWTAADVPDLTGRTVAVTGASSGLGLELARASAARGAHVVLACRDPRRGERAVGQVAREVPDASVELALVDLADLGSVRAAATRLRERHPRLDVLVDNAGVMATPHRRTVDGFELQMGTNHLGHFALTGLLLPSLLAAPAPRVVVMSSFLHHLGGLDPERVGTAGAQRRYSRWVAYQRSKLANVLFATELQHRALTAGSDLLGIGAHPGWAATNLQRGRGDAASSLRARLARVGNALFAQSARDGALPALYAATMPDVAPYDFFGPAGPLELRGGPRRRSPSPRGRDARTARRLWERSEELTGVGYDWSAAPAATT